jgi:hypothetical protein
LVGDTRGHEHGPSSHRNLVLAGLGALALPAIPLVVWGLAWALDALRQVGGF